MTELAQNTKKPVICEILGLPDAQRCAYVPIGVQHESPNAAD